MSSLMPLHHGDFEARVLEAEKPVIVDFGAPWCGPCKMLDPVLEELAVEFNSKVDFYTVNVDDNQQLAMDLGIMSVPTVILFRDGQPVQRLTGFRPKRAIIKKFFVDI